jgi:hypothetical protein
MTTATRIECEIHFERRGRGRKELAAGAEPPAPTMPGRVPRVARLLALAHRLERLARTGAVKDYAELARLGHVTRARISQILSLLNLAPALQEAVLFWPPTERGRDPVILHDLLPLAAAYDWRKQRKMWRRLGEGCGDRSHPRLLHFLPSMGALPPGARRERSFSPSGRAARTGTNCCDPPGRRPPKAANALPLIPTGLHPLGHCR